MDISIIIFFIMLAAHLVFTGIIVINYFTALRINNTPMEISESRKLSILIPARNEEKNIDKIITSIENQDFTNYELIIVDDNSEDATFKIAEGYAKKNNKIMVYHGEELPEGWLGKNWACYQLSKYAEGDLLLFVDSDVRLKKSAILYSLWLMENNDLRMLSVFPSQIMRSFGERIIVPLMNWFLLTFLPLNQVYKSQQKSFIAANGQFLMITRDTYDNIGTHLMFKDKVVEDMEIARAVKFSRNKIMTCLGNNTIVTEMYGSFSEAFNGFSKNFFPGFNISRTYFLLLIAFIFFLFMFPFVFVFTRPLFIVIIFFIILQRLLLSVINKEMVLFNVLFHPLQMVMMIVIGINSSINSKKVWKNRVI